MEKWTNSTVALKFKTIISGDNPNSLKYIIGFVFILGLTAFLSQLKTTDDDSTLQVPSSPTMDTYVPNGMILVNVQLSNYESLDQLIGNYGVVDLYTPPLSPIHEPVLIAKRVKIVKSGNSPPTFYVLVREEESIKITKQSGELLALVRNPESLGTKFVNQKSRTRSRKIFYDVETK